MAMELNPLIYVCVMSDFNLPEFESCLLRRPSHLVLIVSNYEPLQDKTKLFEEVIKKWSKDKITIIRPDKVKGFGGRDLIEYQDWIQSTLYPALNNLPAELPRACNITGGTKAMTLGLLHAHDWEWIDYKAEGHHLQQLIYDSDKKQFFLQNESELPLASPLQVAGLYVEQSKEQSLNVIAKNNPQHLSEAQLLWDGLSVEEPALMELFGSTDKGLERIWMHGRENVDFKKEQLEFSALEFIGLEQFSPEHLAWLESWQQLSPKSLSFSKQHINLPGNSKNDPLKRWLSGDWLELLISDWLIAGTNIPAEQIAINLKTNPNIEKNSYGERETDVLVHTQKGTTIIEVKTDLPPNDDSIYEAIKQITSFADRLGKTNKILFIGPQLYKKIESDLGQVKLSSKAAKIELYSSKAELLAHFSSEVLKTKHFTFC